MPPTLRTIQPTDRDAIATLITHSLNTYYTSIGRTELFPDGPSSANCFYDTYQTLDPDCAVVATSENDEPTGICFYHPRETHISLGIMAVSPNHFGQGIARALLNHIIEFARHEGKPLRLVSSALNLDSFSLYTKAGFTPFCTYQDMVVNVPADGLSGGNEQLADSNRVRLATLDDIEDIAAVEMEVSGIQREKDYRFFIENPQLGWRLVVIEGDDGELDGFLAATPQAIGPGVARNQPEAAALILNQLNAHPNQSPLVIVPVDAPDLVAHLYGWGARNTEIHLAQVLGDAQPYNGISIPSFLPESG